MKMNLSRYIKFFIGLIGLTLSLCVFADNTITLDKIVETHRAMILLLDKSPSNDPLADNIFAARNAYAAKQELIETLLVQIGIDAAVKDQHLTPSSQSLISYTESKLQDHPADLLALIDLYDEFEPIETERQLPQAELEKLQIAINHYKKIYNQYRGDYGKTLDKLTTRGASYELWSEYIKFLDEKYSLKELIQFYTHEQVQLFRYMTRGENDIKSKVDTLINKAPKILWGNNLPEKTVVLTFDDGPHQRNTPLILDILKQYEVHGYFFSLGKNLGDIDITGKSIIGTRNNAAVKRIIDEGNILANHSYSHAILTKLDQNNRKEEIEKTNLLLNETKGSANTLFRPPYGSHDKELDVLTDDEGMVSVMWNIDSMDWADPIPESIVNRTLSELNKYKKGILLFHDIHKQIVNALPNILTALAEQGYRVVTLDGRSFSENSNGLPKIQTAATDFYGESWAVVIGINNYQSWPKLEYAANDAKAVAEHLETKLGFPKQNIITLYDQDATSERIIEMLGYQLADPKKVKENDRVFVFYAGHGMTRELPNGKALGYLIPVDAATDKFQNRAISMTQINDFSSLIPAKHIYFVMDSCYSGLALTRAGVSVGQSLNYINQISNRKARQILTAGGADQQVSDGGPNGHSIFTWTFLQALDGLADTDNNGYVTASEIGTYVSPVVSSYAEQTPSFGNLLGSEGGDFVFKVQTNAVAEINEKMNAESKRIEDELNSVRQNTTANVKRRLELEVSLTKQNANTAVVATSSNSTNTQNAVTNNTVMSTASSEAIASTPSTDERIIQARRLNASALQFLKEKKYVQAKNEWAEAVRLNPYNPTIVNNYAYVLDQLNENDDALKWYYRTVELDPKRTALYWNLGDIMVKMGRKQESIPYYERFLHLYPSYKDAKQMREKIEEYKNLATDIETTSSIVK